ncbi:hypothetical protein EYF80_023088 [Liparis tanakae]|uniref:Uncharacterized protein n=1 Tax=Liparis tanakae TaxID=230148 RepID=A0A4Z2HLC0_9TELE|nr:hypothetical protein EYF80_023088 [Liparis tanakae]
MIGVISFHSRGVYSRPVTVCLRLFGCCSIACCSIYYWDIHFWIETGFSLSSSSSRWFSRHVISTCSLLDWTLPAGPWAVPPSRSPDRDVSVQAQKSLAPFWSEGCFPTGSDEEFAFFWEKALGWSGREFKEHPDTSSRKTALSPREADSGPDCGAQDDLRSSSQQQPVDVAPEALRRTSVGHGCEGTTQCCKHAMFLLTWAQVLLIRRKMDVLCSRFLNARRGPGQCCGVHFRERHFLHPGLLQSASVLLIILHRVTATLFFYTPTKDGDGLREVVLLHGGAGVQSSQRMVKLLQALPLSLFTICTTPITVPLLTMGMHRMFRVTDLLVAKVEGLFAPLPMQLQDGDEVPDGSDDGKAQDRVNADP